jgi:hypothetical protein
VALGNSSIVILMIQVYRDAKHERSLWRIQTVVMLKTKVSQVLVKKLRRDDFLNRKLFRKSAGQCYLEEDFACKPKLRNMDLSQRLSL